MSDGSDELDYTPTVKSVDDGRAEAREVSRSTRELAGITGEVTDPGPGVSTCETDPNREDNLYKMRGGWSIRDVPVGVLEEGMRNLRRELLGQGWVIVEEGELNNAERTPRILFDNYTLEYALNVTLEDPMDDNPYLAATLVSACFRTPEGESPKGQF